MQNLTLSWQASGAGAVLAFGAGVALRGRVAGASAGRLVRVGALLREAGLLLGLFALWQFAGQWSLARAGGAVGRAQWIWDAERWLRLPSEAAVQGAVLPWRWVVEGADYYYAVMHFGVMIGFLLWVFLRRRALYGRIRGLLVLVTGACLLIQLIPVAPPRLLPGVGMVDTGVVYGQSVYAGVGAAGVSADSLSAMPSVHVAWCLVVAIGVFWAAESAWWRSLAVVHVVLTVFVVVVTANHFWLDGVAAAAIVAAAWAVLRVVPHPPALSRGAAPGPSEVADLPAHPPLTGSARPRG